VVTISTDDVDATIGVLLRAVAGSKAQSQMPARRVHCRDWDTTFIGALLRPPVFGFILRTAAKL